MPKTGTLRSREYHLSVVSGPDAGKSIALEGPTVVGSDPDVRLPLTDSAGNVQTLNLSGVRTLRLTDLESSQKNTITVSDLQLNYLLFVPAPAPVGPQRAFIGYASPAGGTVLFDPEGTVEIRILNRDTSVSSSGIQLQFDGVNVTSGATITGTTADGPGATIRYRPPGFLLPNSAHTINVSFNDGSGTQRH